MADRSSKRRNSRLTKNNSTESTEESQSNMGKSVKEKRHKKPKERWLLTRKTWRYMADAGRKLIPEGVHNRPEDIPKIEAYFQEVCKREPNFLLWRKNSYPGALGFRSHRKRKERRKGGSCRKASSADEIQDFKPERPKDLAIPSISGGRFDIQKMKYDFLNRPHSPSSPNKSMFKPPSPRSDRQNDSIAENQLIEMLEKYLSLSNAENPQSSTTSSALDLHYRELYDKLQRHLQLANKSSSQAYVPKNRQQVHFEGDYIQKSLAETLSRYFSQYPNRDKVISDLLTDRKTLQKLYFELRQAKGFRASSSGSSSSYTNQSVPWGQSHLRNSRTWKENTGNSFTSPPPLIEVQSESSEPTFLDSGIQTGRISEATLLQVEEEYKKALAEKEEEARDLKPSSSRRRSSVDNDDVSQSVSDTIKRYLRMARKKSVDASKPDRFKRVNYDRNLRNIKAKGEITKPGDDDGLNKGCQTNDDWIISFKHLKFSDSGENAGLGSPNSTDAETVESPKSPTHPSSFLSNLSNLLHGKHSHDKSSSSSANAGGAMQKSKSSSSVMHHGSRLVAKKIFRSRSKSQTRPAPTHSSWTPQVGYVCFY